MNASKIVTALAGCTAEELQWIGEQLAIGFQRGMAPRRTPAPQPTKPKRLSLAPIVEAVFATPETDAAIAEFDANDNHAASCEDIRCSRCRNWTAERQRRIARLGQLYARARKAGFDLDAEQASAECGIPAAVVTSMLADVRR